MIVLITGAGSGIGRAVALALGRAGHLVYASMRMTADGSRAEQLVAVAAREGLDVNALELDVLSEASCRSAVDQILFERGRIDAVVNNAGMLMTGVAEAFTPAQLLQALDTNAVSWLRVNRAVLPAMRRQGRGVLVYIGSTVASIREPFIGPYVASKAAADALAEVMALEASPFGVESVIVAPGAFTSGTDHFAHAHPPADAAVLAQYGDLPDRVRDMPARLDAIDAANGGALSVSAVGEAVAAVLALPHGERPPRVVIDGQRKGVDALNALHRATQAAFFERMGIADLMTLPPSRR